MKRMFSLFCVVALLIGGLSLLNGCNRQKDDGVASVYFLNFKPEQDAQWKELAKTYTEKTGVPVTVVTAASGGYEDTLGAEIVKSNPPTLFQVNGPVGLEGFKSYCYNLKDTGVYKALSNEDFVLKENDQVLGIAYVLETYGIIYNKEILDRYFALPDAKITSLNQVNNFETFSTLVGDIQSKKEALGILGAFTSSGMDSSSDWRFKTHLANLPIYYEYMDQDADSLKELSGTYLNHYRKVWDLYLNNATCAPAEIGAKTQDDAKNEFLNKQAVFYQNGTWAWDKEMEQKLGAENVGMLPIYIGAEGEERQGLCTGSENYWCVNKKAGEEDIKATLDFLNWVVTSQEGTRALAEEMGFEIPFKAALPSKNPLIKEAKSYLDAGKIPVDWNFSTIPGEQWKNGVGSVLLAYAQGGQTDELWEKMKEAFVGQWKSLYNSMK